MKLSNQQIMILFNMGHTMPDILQIEEALNKTIYTHCYGNVKRKIGIKKAISLLGEETFLSGLSRSAFHWDSSRQIGETNAYVCFDSRPLFES